MGKLWRCEQCDALLGHESRGELEIRHKGAQWRVRGADAVTTVCVRCGQINERRSPKKSAAF